MSWLDDDITIEPRHEARYSPIPGGYSMYSRWEPMPYLSLACEILDACQYDCEGNEPLWSLGKEATEELMSHERHAKQFFAWLNARLPRDVILYVEYDDCLTLWRRVIGQSRRHERFVHALNRDMDLEAINAYIDGFMCIQGEICASRLGDELLCTHGPMLAIVLQGVPVMEYDWDCWSYVDLLGRRYASKHKASHANTHRHEAWLVPSQCQFVALIADEAIQCSSTVWRTE